MSDDPSDARPHAEPAAPVGRLADPWFLVNADPGTVMALLDTAAGPAARLAASVYRASTDLHRDVTAGVRRQLLALDAARYGDRELSARITAATVEGEPAAPWGVEWATGSQLDRSLRRIPTAHTDALLAVATAVVDGRPVVVTGGTDRDVRVWDLTTGQQIGQPLAAHTGQVGGVATAVVDGRPVALIGSGDRTVRVWDLTTGQQIGQPLAAHTGQVGGVATAVVDGRPVALIGSGDRTVRVWDLTTGWQIGQPLTGHAGTVSAVATAVVDARPLLEPQKGKGARYPMRAPWSPSSALPSKPVPF
ncbi:hypothetical protein [Kitasatospora sp. NPDC056731]|uniref:hypothetical protein n=1 Tax=Kitasatospora sp. NPDC056731 TaxID=3155422 RepID=UPI00342BEA6C